MNKNIRIRKFVRFLKNNNIYQHYMACATSPKCNFDSNISTIKQVYDSLETFLVSTTTRGFISHAFSWEKAPQGYNFWAKINVKWLRYIDNEQKMQY